MKNKEKWVGVSVDSKDATRNRNAKHQQLDDALYLWFSDMTAHHAAINDEMLITKAKQLGEQLNITDFSYSRGYLHRFKTRRGIKRKLYEGEADSADMTKVEAGRSELQRVLKGYHPDDIFNLDETGLFYRLGPNYTLATSKVSGTKKSKDRITVALTTNATGSTNIKPFVIAKVHRPRCFGKTYNPQTYVRYRNNAKAWMTAELFIEWLKDFDRQMRLVTRKVILLVDNAASHTAGDLLLTNVKLHFLPPNTTAHIQPMDAGIIKAFKAHYRKQLVAHYIECAEKNENQTVNLREALHMVKVAWERVSPSTISNCYRHVNILPPVDEFDENDNLPLSNFQRRAHGENGDDDDDDDIPLIQLQQQMRKLPEPPTMTAEEFLNIDAEEETGHQLTDDDIMMLVSREEVPDCSECDDDQDIEPMAITTKEASGSISALISYFEQSATTTEDGMANGQFLDQLWSIKTVLTNRQASESRQMKMTDYFKK